MTGSMSIGQTVPDGSTEKWKDKKRYLWLWGLMVPGFPRHSCVVLLRGAEAGQVARLGAALGAAPSVRRRRPVART